MIRFIDVMAPLLSHLRVVEHYPSVAQRVADGVDAQVHQRVDQHRVNPFVYRRLVDIHRRRSSVGIKDDFVVFAHMPDLHSKDGCKIAAKAPVVSIAIEKVPTQPEGLGTTGSWGCAFKCRSVPYGFSR